MWRPCLPIGPPSTGFTRRSTIRVSASWSRGRPTGRPCCWPHTSIRFRRERLDRRSPRGDRGGWQIDGARRGGCQGIGGGDDGGGGAACRRWGPGSRSARRAGHLLGGDPRHHHAGGACEARCDARMRPWSANRPRSSPASRSAVSCCCGFSGRASSCTRAGQRTGRRGRRTPSTPRPATWWRSRICALIVSTRCWAEVVVTPTLLEAGVARNVTPPRCEAVLDIRTTPSYVHAEIVARVEK